MIALQKPLVLASNSPRRQQLLKELGFDFQVEVRPTDETFPLDLLPQTVPAYLAQKKAQEFKQTIADRLILCADTVVILENTILNKPQNQEEAYKMLRRLSGYTHEVATGVCLLTEAGIKTETDIAKVTFKPLTNTEIKYYVAHYQPFDKAGGYGIQEWIGMIGIERIEGSFYTIMGLPVHKVYQMLLPYIVF